MHFFPHLAYISIVNDCIFFTESRIIISKSFKYRKLCEVLLSKYRYIDYLLYHLCFACCHYISSCSQNTKELRESLYVLRDSLSSSVRVKGSKNKKDNQVEDRRSKHYTGHLIIAGEAMFLQREACITCHIVFSYFRCP